MYNVNFTSVAEGSKLNKLNDSETAILLKRYMENMNYREEYNKNKTKLSTLLKNDPIVKERMELLKKKA